MLGVQNRQPRHLPGCTGCAAIREPLDARCVFAAVRALYVFRELLFELGPPAGPSPGAGPAHSSAPATPTAAKARVIVLIRAPRRRSRTYQQARQQQRQADATSNARMTE
jgi:hypothetical protein